MNSELLKSFSIKRFTDQGQQELHDQVVVEKTVKLVIDGGEPLAVSLSPHLLEEFLCGFLLTSGFIRSLADIREYSIGPDSLEVSLLKPVAGHRALASGCTGTPLPEAFFDRPPLPPQPFPESEILLPGFAKFLACGEIFQASGGTHAAALARNGEILCFAEDIGRHNALDKVVGMALKAGLDFSGLSFYSSGRVSAEIVRKALRAGIGIIVSHSAPTSLAVRLAIRANLTLLGFVRGRRFNVYSGAP